MVSGSGGFVFVGLFAVLFLVAGVGCECNGWLWFVIAFGVGDFGLVGVVVVIGYLWCVLGLVGLGV